MEMINEKPTMNEKPIKNRQVAEVWRRIKKNKVAMFGLMVIVIVILMAIFADVITNYDEMAIKQNAKAVLQYPSTEHWFGTDAFGRDVFARIVHGTRASLTLGISATFISLVFGVIIGAAAGYYGGIIDEIIMRILDMIMCIPGLLLALAIVAALGPGLRNMLIAITISMVPGFARVVRAVVLTIVGEVYIEAARCCGTRDFKILLIHVIPNAMGPIIVQATMSISGMILIGAGLSYIGMGIQPPAPEWGAMLSEANNYMRQYPYLVIFPGFALILTSLAFNLFGDGLRDALDPKLKN